MVLILCCIIIKSSSVYGLGVQYNVLNLPKVSRNGNIVELNWVYYCRAQYRPYCCYWGAVSSVSCIWVQYHPRVDWTQYRPYILFLGRSIALLLLLGCSIVLLLLLGRSIVLLLLLGRSIVLIVVIGAQYRPFLVFGVQYHPIVDGTQYRPYILFLGRSIAPFIITGTQYRPLLLLGRSIVPLLLMGCSIVLTWNAVSFLARLFIAATFKDVCLLPPYMCFYSPK